MGKDRIAFSTAALYPLESEDALALIGEAGFPKAELMPQAFRDVSDAAALAYEKTGVSISSIHYPLAMFAMLYTAHSSMSAEGRDFSAKLVSLASRMGTEYLVIHPADGYSGGIKEMMERGAEKNIRFLADLCHSKGITVAMENYPSGAGRQAETLDAYTASWNIPNMKPMVDTTEVMEGGENPIEFIRAMKEAPCHLHISDFGGGKKHLPMGEGEIDWKEFFSALREKNYRGYYTLEPSYRYYLGDRKSILEKGRRFLLSFLES
jgi:sugar phosphate isomerase/epimerase